MPDCSFCLFSAPNLSLQGPQGPLSSFLLMSSSTSVPLGNEAVVKMAPGRAGPVQEGERRRPEGPQSVYCSKVVSVCVPVCWYTYEHECGFVWECLHVAGLPWIDAQAVPCTILWSASYIAPDVNGTH